MTRYARHRRRFRVHPAAIAAAVLLAGTFPAARADAAGFTILGHLPHLPHLPHLARVQRALEYQVNRQVARHWPVSPAWFGPHGIPIILKSAAAVQAVCGQGAGGCHEWATGPGLGSVPATIYIAYTDRLDETIAISHEIIEFETDPQVTTMINGWLTEACDPVDTSDAWYYVGSVGVADFVYPRFFMGVDHPAPWDWLRLTKAPQRPLPGASMADVTYLTPNFRTGS